MEPARPMLRRCAIYTRKSSEEGLDQNFNSLHAQREACEAFIKSQASEGWRLIRTAYDDAGLSGATMERPALKRLLDHIRRDLARCGVRAAVRGRNTPALFDWLLEMVSYQGIGNHVAEGYMNRHGRVGWDEIAGLIEARPSCPKLRSYWHFDHCGYQKGRHSCSEPDHFP